MLSMKSFQPGAIVGLSMTTETNMNKNSIPIYRNSISECPIMGRSCEGSNLDFIQTRFNVRQDFFGDEMTSFAPLCKCERLLPGHDWTETWKTKKERRSATTCP